ncbi:MAG TPA: hypothetical protein VFA94_15975 [Acidimicrobiales bacterium]|nr:hypothetical protein [Acidimicrobiales bacterium]
MTAATADDYTGTTTPTVLGEQISRTTTGAVAATNTARGLPVTGGDIAGLTVAGLGAIGVGTVLVRRGRRRPTTA